MVVAVFGAAIWLALCIDAPTEVRAGLVPMALSYLLAGFVPIWLRHSHMRAQNRLLDKCRALLMAGSRALAQGDRAGAAHLLVRIRRLERLWRLGDSGVFRLSLALWAIGTAVVLCVLTRYFGLLVRHHVWVDQPLPADEIVAHLKLAAIVSVAAPLEALIAYSQAWRRPWAVDNCGDRLWQLLHGPRAMAASPRSGKNEPDLNVDGLTPREIFGLGPSFSRRDLDKARRRLVWDLHPDRQRGSSVRERNAREAALKQVNAAYDRLRPEAR
jgi:hypothetical protein